MKVKLNREDNRALVRKYVLLLLTEEEKEFVDRVLQKAPRFLCGERKFPRIVKESFVKAAQALLSSSEGKTTETLGVKASAGYSLPESPDRKKPRFRKIVWYKIDPETLNFLKENTRISRLFKICYLYAAKKVAELSESYSKKIT